ncbi:MAG: type II toxin-antitoxin system YafQ family toxin [Syntrophales bacterium]|nr:type II toxin-antitoxin system YafQ family toxin [Syntrophales bacterium]
MKAFQDSEEDKGLTNVKAPTICSRPLDRKFRDHDLIGNFKDRRECHVEPDWLLIYRTEESAIIFERTGTHADLFR